MIQEVILSNSYPACLISKAPDGLYSPTSSPLPNFSDALAKLIIGLVWFFKKINEMVIRRNAGKVIHKANVLADEFVTLDFGTSNSCVYYKENKEEPKSLNFKDRINLPYEPGTDEEEVEERRGGGGGWEQEEEEPNIKPEHQRVP